jgi:hypothetical protein
MEQEKPERSIGLTPAQVAGSALAAVSAALLASFAGTTGTIIGAAVGSVVATVGAATYTWSLRRTSEVVRRTAAQVRQTAILTGPLPRSVAQGPLRSGEDRQKSAEVPSDGTDERPENTVTAPADDAGRRGLPWVKVLIASVAVTVVALGGITAVEAITGKPVSSWFGNNNDQGTSVGHLVGSDSSKSTKPAKKQNRTPAPSQTPSPAGPKTPVTPTPTNLPSTPPQQQQPQPSPPAPSTLP